MESVLNELNQMKGLLVAFVLSGLIGWQRERGGHNAGLRTHILVAVSAALFIVLSEELVRTFANRDDQVRFDVIGVLGAVVSGVSFLGAGAIFSSQRGEGMKGLTTAAGLLATAAIGIACGLHLYVLAAGATALFLLTLGPLGHLSDQLGARDQE